MVGGDQPAEDMNNAAVVADSNPTLVVGLLPVGRVAPDVRVNQERYIGHESQRTNQVGSARSADTAAPSALVPVYHTGNVNNCIQCFISCDKAAKPPCFGHIDRRGLYGPYAGHFSSRAVRRVPRMAAM